MVIRNLKGLHIRAASKLAKLATQFMSSIQARQKTADAKSIMSLLMLTAGQGTKIKVIVAGSDELLALAVLLALIKNGFGEEVNNAQN